MINSPETVKKGRTNHKVVEHQGQKSENPSYNVIVELSLTTSPAADEKGSLPCLLSQSIALKHGEIEDVDFSPFFLAFNVEVLSGGVSAASFTSFEKTIAKLSKQRWKKREGGAKNRAKQWKRA